VTADGLTVDGASQLNTTGLASGLTITGNDNNNVKIRFDNIGTGGGDFVIQSGIQGASNEGLSIRDLDNSAQRLYISSGGDVSFYEDTGTTAKMVWDASAESLGIGTASPASTLDIVGLNKDAIKIRSDVAPENYYQIGRNQSTGLLEFKGSEATYNGYLFKGPSSDLMTIDSSGNVGIGTDNPIRKLHIYESGTGNVGIEIDNPQVGEACTIGKQGNTAYGATSVGDTHVYTYDSNITLMADGGAGNTSAIKFATGGNTERARIDSSGNLLVGTTTKGNISSAHEIRGNSSSGGTSVLTVANMTGTAQSPALNVANKDTSTDSTNRFVQFYADYTGSTAVAMGGIVGNGSGSVQFATISDKREKENINSVNSVADKIKQLNVVEFDFIKTGDHVDYGFIAQDVQDVFPDFVVDNMASDGAEERLGLAGGMSSGYIAVLTKALQEALERIEKLENK
jgi:hypothetical protein